MLQKLLCFLLGHKTVVKAYTGETITGDTTFDRDVKHLCYKWQRLSFCVRCGKAVDPLIEL